MKNKQTVIGVDIGGTKIFSARFSSSLNIEKETKIRTGSEKGKEYVLANIEEAIREVLDDSVQSIGIAWAGFVDSRDGVIKKAPNIEGFEDFPLRQYLESVFHLPVKIENDARLFALSEQKIYSENTSVLLGIIIGTGVGSGVIVDGKILKGNTDFAGEVGHILLGEEHLEEAEDFFAGPALVRLFHRELGIDHLRDLDSLWDTHSIEIRQIMDPVLDRMAHWIYNLLLAFNPGKIIFGGGVGKNFLPHFELELRHKIQDIIHTHGYPIDFNISFSKLKNAGAAGAAIVAQSIKSDDI